MLLGFISVLDLNRKRVFMLFTSSEGYYKCQDKA